MKFVKYMFTLALAFCAFAGISNAQTVAFLGGGSSALFSELGSASQSIPNISCLWTHSKATNPATTPYFAATDNRSGVGLDEQGQIFIAWGPGGGTCASPSGSYSIYAYIQLDSTIGDRCYFAVDSTGTAGCTLTLSPGTTPAGSNLIPGVTDTPLPSGVSGALAGQHFFVAGTDIRPEDAKFATNRMFAVCNQYFARQYFNNDSYYLFGLGYANAGNPNVGVAVQGNGGPFNVINFNINGNDPISGNSVPAYAVSTVGVQPIIVAVAPAAGVGTSNNGNIQAMTDINAATLALFLEGILGRTSDFYGAPTSGAQGVTTLVREPLSGTYNTMEFSIPQSTQFHAGQDYGNCNGSGTVLSNTSGTGMNLASANGHVGNRLRQIGTGKVVAALQAASNPTLGYFFWSAGNVTPVIGGSVTPLTNVKYLKVNGIDPLLDQNAAGYKYSGVLPNTGGTFCSLGTSSCDPGLSAVSFAGVNAGNYPIWSALRLVGPPGNAGVAAMITALGVIDPTQHDYIGLNNLKVWRSHFFINPSNSSNIVIGNAATGPSVGTSTLCGGGNAENGGDVGGAILLINNNADYCSDFSDPNGKLNLTF
jgi:hypothetical protein